MRWAIATLTALAAMVAALNEVASLARFASERLHFPSGLGWTLPGMVTIATLAGALMWTVLHDVALRAAGRRLNIVCAAISALAVGLDHASGADGWWIVPAGLVGALVPALATWLTHLLARMTAEPAATQADLAVAPDVPNETPFPCHVAERAPLHAVPPVQPVEAKRAVPAVKAAPTTSARVPTVDERAASLIAAGAGRKRLARELDISEYAARLLIEQATT